MSAALGQIPVETLMDSVYRRQRHIYDLTRRYYLLGRDQLISALDPPVGGSVLEVGCGTARNLIAAARLFPGAMCYGVDISGEMLRTARVRVADAGLGNRIHLAKADATDFDAEVLFRRSAFDRVFFSFSLSMIPCWREALRHAADLAEAPGGRLQVVDFGNQERLPTWFRSALHGWLSRFHVTPRTELRRVLEEISAERNALLRDVSLYRGYSRYAEVRF
jgi:S-adenosylmethionine-diacylgycerolhomoserine-N-methlytransferase